MNEKGRKREREKKRRKIQQNVYIISEKSFEEIRSYCVLQQKLVIIEFSFKNKTKPQKFSKRISVSVYIKKRKGLKPFNCL